MTNLPQGWEWKSLGEICFITDGTHKTPNYIETGIPFLSVKNISKGFFDLSDVKYISLEEHNKLIKRAKPEFGDILICRIGTLGKAIKISLEFEFSIFVSLGLLKPKVKIISDYLVYFLNSYFIEGWINDNKVGGGTHTAKLNLNILEKCPIALPPLKEQERIVGILDESFAKIDESIKILEQDLLNLDELMQSALQKAFNPLKDNAKENYKLPQSWEWKSLGEIGFFIRGVSYKKEQLLSTKNENSVYLLRANNIQNELNLDELQIIPKELVVDKIIQNNDILFAMSSGSKHIVGKNILLNNLNDFTFGAFCGLFRIINLNICHKFIAYYLRSDSYKNYIFNISKGSNINNLRFIDLEKFQIPLPPLKEQEQIASHLDELSSHVKNLKQNYQAQIKDLQELKKSLLDKAFKGNL
ncbi:restriction endonuclease subunit S [Campylobacter coli]|nr:restriction endonuclease subunit S [Campylobacter coli]